jgi:PPM family protein phosphatase
MKLSEFTGNGRRVQNEDNKLVMQEQGIFMICDGVGGHAKGEVASRLCCESFKDFFENNIGPINIKKIRQALAITETKFDEYISLYENATGMATTLAFVHLNGDKVLAAHAGDSRVYHIRNRKILFVTNDHTVPNELVTAGIITKEETINHPLKNQITRALSGSRNPTEPDFYALENISPGDYFFLCSDGVIESVSNEMLTEIISDTGNPSDAVKKLADICENNSRDNFTGIVIRV